MPRLPGENLHGRFLREWKAWGLDDGMGRTTFCLIPFVIVFDIWLLAHLVKEIAG